ncbi:hypothetical protein [Ornithinimicrobium cerasi]|uniref:hypothetical protein n=1 Tax=Ornithinimicrobium cerasi TaxID=2248773 RepID=UPI00137AB69E|nr:hypothetical protein [Ornithinimicrobium cerasi]
MTGVSVTQASGEALVRAHGPALQRTAVMLTGQPAVAEALVAEVLQGAAGPRPPALEELRRRLVRAHRRSGRTGARDRLAVTDAPSDVGDLLHDLPPRQRAALVLHLTEDVPLGDAARTARVPERRVRRLVETVPELGEALRAVADRHARPDHEVVRALLDRLPTDATTVGRATPYPSSRLRHPRRWLAGATAVAVLGAGTVAALTWPQDPPETPGGGATPHLPPGTGPAPPDLVLDEEGDPPRSAEGLRLADILTIDYRHPRDPLDLSGFAGASGYARWGVLWCDLPAVDDDHLVVPELTLDLDGGPVVLACTGRTTTPSPTRLTALPIGLAGDVPVAWSGDLPGRGTATLAVYGETDPWSVTRRQGTQPEPPVADGSAAVTAADVVMQGWEGPVHARVVEVGHDSTLTVWAGSSAALGVVVDDVRLTDDGDLRARYLNPPPALWRTQDPSLREGRWVVGTPDQARTFPLPDALRPPPGERREVTVTAALSPPDATARWQVQVSDSTPRATPGPDLALRPGRAGDGAVDPGSGPEQIGGVRLAGSWQVPQDGVPHPVEAPAGDLTKLVVAAPGGTGEDVFDELGLGSVTLGGRATLFPTGSGIAEHLAWGLGPWQVTGAPGPGGPLPDDALTLRLPAVPGHPPAAVLAYLPVPYEDFDMSGAPLLPTSWRVGEPSPMGGHGTGGPSPVAVPERRPDGTFLLEGRHQGAGTTLEVTTRGRGRLRVLADGEPLTHLAPAHDGWWSTWTDAHVVSRVDVWTERSGVELVVEVEGWEEGFELAVLRW